MPTVYFLNR